MDVKTSYIADKLIFIVLMAAMIVSVASMAYYQFSKDQVDIDRQIKNKERVHRDMTKLKAAINSYAEKYKKYPLSLENLVPEFIGAIPVDPWNKRYKYELKGNKVIVSSYGKDGVAGKHPWFDFETLDTYMFLDPLSEK